MFGDNFRRCAAENLIECSASLHDRILGLILDPIEIRIDFLKQMECIDEQQANVLYERADELLDLFISAVTPKDIIGLNNYRIAPLELAENECVKNNPWLETAYKSDDKYCVNRGEAEPSCERYATSLAFLLNREPVREEYLKTEMNETLPLCIRVSFNACLDESVDNFFDFGR